MRLVISLIIIFMSCAAVAQQVNEDSLRDARRPKYVGPNDHLPLCSEVGEVDSPEAAQCRVDGELHVSIRLEYSSPFTIEEFEKIVVSLGTVERMSVEVTNRYAQKRVIFNKVQRPFSYDLTIKVPTGKESDYCAAYLSVESLKEVANTKDTVRTDYLSCHQSLGGPTTGSAGVRN